MPKANSARAKSARWCTTTQSTTFLKPPTIARTGCNPSITKVKTAQFPFEEKQSPRFAKSTSRNLEKMERVWVDTTMDTLIGQRSELFPVEGLTLVNTSQFVVDRDGIPLMVFLKGGLKWPLPFDPSERGLEAIKRFIQKSPPPKPKHDDVRHQGIPHPLGVGVHHLAFWHAIGKAGAAKRQDEPGKGAIISNDICKAAYRINATIEFMNNFTPITQAVGALFEQVDYDNYQRYLAQFHQYAPTTATKLMHTTSRNCFLGMAVLTKLRCKPHRDSQDTIDGWVADMAFGDFSGGYLEVPQTGRMFKLEPGDIIFMRSHILQHSVSQFTGERYGIVMFSHGSVMKE